MERKFEFHSLDLHLSTQLKPAVLLTVACFHSDLWIWNREQESGPKYVEVK